MCILCRAGRETALVASGRQRPTSRMRRRTTPGRDFANSAGGACRMPDMEEPGNAVSNPEDRRKHLDFIQAIVTRMSAASSSAKSWLLPVVAATFGYAVTKGVGSVALLGAGAVVLFGFIDANYLRQEKAYRRLYKAVAAGTKSIQSFSLDPSDSLASPADRAPEGWPTWMPDWIDRLVPGPSVWASWSIGPFYGVLLVAGILLTCL